MTEDVVVTHTNIPTMPQSAAARRRLTLGVTAVFTTQFVSMLFINARNIVQPQIIAEFDGMALFSWLIALPALAGSTSTLLFGKLSDSYSRRTILLVSMALFGIGLALSTQVTSMPLLVAAATFMSIGHFPIVPLCFMGVGDLFSARELAKWTGLLSLPSGIAAMIGPVVGGVVAQSVFGWRALYWGTIPLLILAGILVVVALPKSTLATRPRVDIWGMLVMIPAITTLIFGFSRLGLPGMGTTGAALLVVSAVAWVGFIWIEKRVAAPILAPQLLVNRTFLTVAAASFLSYFGMLGVMAYSPIFVQAVMGINPAISGSMLTPFTVIVAFMGIPAGFLLARTGRYRWMYIVAYAVAILCLSAMWRFTAQTPIWLFVLVTTVAGLGLGAIPIINTLVAQFAVPKRLLGVAVGAVFFFQMLGISTAPAILGIAQNSAPDLERGLQRVFLVGAVAMVVSLLIVLTIPEVSVDGEVGESNG